MPWSRPGSGSALLFEAMVVELAKSQPVADVAVQVGEHDTRLWRLIRHYVCVCSIESGPCERVESLQMSGRF